ncbi:hypothetical protein BG58_33950 [Caballeronia jiangsuensis]|nr:hypothetical protein BG58_33950 [Caballeronia jiangsuensis]
MASSRDGASLVRRAREASKLFPLRDSMPVGAFSRVDQMLETRVIPCVTGLSNPYQGRPR